MCTETGCGLNPCLVVCCGSVERIAGFGLRVVRVVCAHCSVQPPVMQALQVMGGDGDSDRDMEQAIGYFMAHLHVPVH